MCIAYRIAARNWYWSAREAAIPYVPALIVLGFLCGVAVWYMRWPGLMRASGMPSPYHDRARVRRFIGLAMWPVGGIGLAIGGVQAMLTTLDYFFPHWWG